MIIQFTGNIINEILRTHYCLIRRQTIDSNKIQPRPIRAKNIKLHQLVQQNPQPKPANELLYKASIAIGINSQTLTLCRRPRWWQSRHPNEEARTNDDDAGT